MHEGHPRDVRFSAGGVPARIRPRLPVSAQQAWHAFTSQSSETFFFRMGIIS